MVMQWTADLEVGGPIPGWLKVCRGQLTTVRTADLHVRGRLPYHSTIACSTVRIFPTAQR